MSTSQEILSRNLKALRKEKKLYQRDIAERSGILASTYSRIETMEVAPNLQSIDKIAMALEVPVSELFQTKELTDLSLIQKLEAINALSEYNRNVLEIMMESIIAKDKLEKAQEYKRKARLQELERIREK